MHDRLRRLARCFVPSAGLRDAIRQDRIAQYRAFKHYFKTQFAADNARNFPDFLAVVATVKNEALYLAEWIEYHKLIGVDKFYIYDNESSDNTATMLKSWIDRGDVVYQFWPGKRQQLAIYNEALNRYRQQARWLAFIDIDEFIVPLTTPTMRELLAEFNDEVGLSMHWLYYGDNGHETLSDGLVIERFTAHAPRPETWMKPIVNPRAAFAMETHHGCYIGNRSGVDENHHKVRSRSEDRVASRIRLNHYWGKTWEEYQIKRERGRSGERSDELPSDRSRFDQRNRNEIQDEIMQRYVPLVKANIAKVKNEM